MKNEAGIIKILLFLVVGVSVLFLVFAFVASKIAPLNSPTDGTSSGPTSLNDYETRANSLLDFSFGGADYGNYGGSDRDIGGVDAANRSKYAGAVYMSAGSASYSIQPYEEYITIENEGAPVNITGWKLENGKGSRPIEYSQNSYVYPSAESVIIGQGTQFLDPSGSYVLGPIILGTRERAIVTSGKPFSNFPLPIYTNFKENICVGYLENYPFNPQIDRTCPLPTDDPQIRTVTDECYDYLRSLNRCQNPETTDKDDFDLQTSHCKAFIKSRLNYKSCVANNRYGSGFTTKQWRIFLSRSHEMWDDDRELITLYDANGLIVDQISY